MLNAEDALRTILEAAPRINAERIPLLRCLRRVLAEEIIASRNLPPFRSSSMDGYAVRCSDLEGASPSAPVSLRVAGESRAGAPFHRSLPKNSAVRIMTGAVVPDGAEAVIPIELLHANGRGRVVIERPPQPAENLRMAGEDITAGDTVMRAGDFLTPAHAGVLASLGYANVRVSRRPRVAIVATGDELVEPGRKLRDGQIYNSTSFALQGLIDEGGGKARFVGLAGDSPGRTKRLLREALPDDVVLITGGVSVGAYDVVKDVLPALGVETLFWKVNIKPGMPLVFGKRGRTLVFGLPGNPVSTGVTFLQFVRPALLTMAGASEVRLPRRTAVTDEALRKKDGKRHFLRAVAREEGGILRVRTTGSQSSGVLTSLLKANCLIILPESTTEVSAGERVEIELLPQ